MLFQSCINALEIHGASSCFRSQDTQFTTGNPIVAECRPLCRVPKVEHSATRAYTECYPKNTRQHFDTRQIWLLPSAARKHTVNIMFAESFAPGTRQIWTLPSVAFIALGKDSMCPPCDPTPCQRRYRSSVCQRL